MRPWPSFRQSDDIAQAGSSQPFVAVIDVDRFDVLDELVGYAPARRVLASLAEDILRLLPDSGRTRIQRTSVAVEFEASDGDGAIAAVEKAIGGLNRHVEVLGYRFDLAITAGIVPAVQGRRAELERAAERAVATARRRQVRVQLCADDDAMPAADRLSLMRSLQQAMRDDALELHYQPKVRTRTGEVVAAEALVRWNDPDRGAVSPAMFVPIAERTGDIAALTEWVVGRAIEDQARLLRMGHKLTIDLNISGGLLADPDYGWKLLHLFTALQGQIGFEITETAMIGDPQRALSNLQIFAEAGIRLAIDDYGSGFSSLAYLQQLPITELKIDRMFVCGLTSSQRDPLLIRSTIDLAHALGMEVTAEGVDSPATLALLQVMGCDQVQGYLLSRPLPVDRLAPYLATKREAGVTPPAPAPANLQLLRKRRSA